MKGYVLCVVDDVDVEPPLLRSKTSSASAQVSVFRTYEDANERVDRLLLLELVNVLNNEFDKDLCRVETRNEKDVSKKKCKEDAENMSLPFHVEEIVKRRMKYDEEEQEWNIQPGELRPREQAILYKYVSKGKYLEHTWTYTITPFHLSDKTKEESEEEEEEEE
jgi:hypothetical protein